MKKVVICDRFVDSTYAYQVIGKKVKLSFIDNIQKVILGNLKTKHNFFVKSIFRIFKKKINEKKSKKQI